MGTQNKKTMDFSVNQYGYKLPQIEAYLLKEGLLRLDSITSLKGDSLSEKIMDFFEQNNVYSTYTVSDDSLQCSSGKRRTIGDIFRIIKYYEADVSLEDIYNEVDNLTRERKLYATLCGTAKGITYQLARVVMANSGGYSSTCYCDYFGFGFVPKTNIGYTPSEYKLEINNA